LEAGQFVSLRLRKPVPRFESQMQAVTGYRRRLQAAPQKFFKTPLTMMLIAGIDHRLTVVLKQRTINCRTEPMPITKGTKLGGAGGARRNTPKAT